MTRILVIDDDASVTASIKMMLELSGFAVSVAHDGRSGIKAVEAGKFDLMIVDIFMPDMDGFETLQVLRQRHPSMPILVMSGVAFPDPMGKTPHYLSMATKLGANESLHKPFTPQELLGAIQRCLAWSGRPAS